MAPPARIVGARRELRVGQHCLGLLFPVLLQGGNLCRQELLAHRVDGRACSGDKVVEIPELCVRGDCVRIEQEAGKGIERELLEMVRVNLASLMVDDAKPLGLGIIARSEASYSALHHLISAHAVPRPQYR